MSQDVNSALIAALALTRKREEVGDGTNENGGVSESRSRSIETREDAETDTSSRTISTTEEAMEKGEASEIELDGSDDTSRHRMAFAVEICLNMSQTPFPKWRVVQVQPHWTLNKLLKHVMVLSGQISPQAENFETMKCKAYLPRLDMMEVISIDEIVMNDKLIVCSQGRKPLPTKVLGCGERSLGQQGLTREQLQRPQGRDTLFNSKWLQPETIHSLAGRRIVQVSCGTVHTMMITVNGQLLGFGCTSNGRLGQGYSPSVAQLSPRRVELPYGARAVKVSCGDNYTGVIGKRWKLKIDDNHLGNGTANGTNEHALEDLESGDRKEHLIFTFGRGGPWLGLGLTHGDEETNDVWTPKVMYTSHASSGEDEPVSLACGTRHTLFATRDGKLFSCGTGENGKLGHTVIATETDQDVDGKTSLNDRSDKLDSGFHVLVPTFRDFDRPEQVMAIKNERIADVAAGYEHSAVITDAGSVITFGNNKYGQLGHGSKEHCPTPKMVMSSSEFTNERCVRVVCGKRHTAALTASGKLYTWGLDTGSKGNSEREHCLLQPMVVNELASETIVDVDSGNGHLVCCTKSGAAFGMGGPFQSEAIGEQEAKTSPKAVHLICDSSDHICSVATGGGNGDLVFHLSDGKQWVVGTGHCILLSQSYLQNSHIAQVNSTPPSPRHPSEIPSRKSNRDVCVGVDFNGNCVVN